MSAAKIFALGLFVFLISPFFILGFHIHDISLPDVGEVIWVLKNTFYQSLGSSIGAGILGLILSFGLVSFGRSQKYIEYALVLPSFLPSLFLILTILSLVDPFPIGTLGIILVHTLGFGGLIAVELSYLYREKIGRLCEVSLVLGFSRFQFLKLVLGLLRKDILGLLSVIFLSCFTSFAIPLAVGGGRGTTLEVLIYEKIRISGKFSEALFLSVMQTVLLILFVWLFRRGRNQQSQSVNTRLPLLSIPWLRISVFIYIGTFVYAFVVDSITGWQQIFNIPGMTEIILDVIPLSLVLSVSVGVFIYVILMGIAFASRIQWIQDFLFSYVTPSTALIGFAYLYLGLLSENLSYLLFIFGFVLLSISSLYRIGFDRVLLGIGAQRLVGQILGGSELLIAQKIIWPQVHQAALRVGGIGAVWALGDFALSKIIFSRDVTLGLVVESLMSSYRISAAVAVMSLILVLGGILYLIFKGVGYVSRS